MIHAELQAYLAAHKIDVVAMVHHETCSGMLNPLEEIGAMAKACGALFVVDGVSSVGAEVVDMEAVQYRVLFQFQFKGDRILPRACRLLSDARSTSKS